MMDLSAIARFAKDRVLPAAAGWNCGDGAPSPDLFAQAAALGLMRLSVPVSDGGMGLGFALRAQALRSLAAVDFGFAMAVVNSHNMALRLATDAAPGLRARVLPALLAGGTLGCTALTEPGAGSSRRPGANPAAGSWTGQRPGSSTPAAPIGRWSMPAAQITTTPTIWPPFWSICMPPALPGRLATARCRNMRSALVR